MEVGEGDKLHQGLEPACLQDIYHVLLVEDQLGDEEHESVPLLPVHAPVQHGEDVAHVVERPDDLPVVTVT